MSSSFSYLNENAIVSYHEGLEHGRDKLPAKISKKISAGRKLTATENLIVEGLKEVKEEFCLAQEDRLGWIQNWK